VRLLSVVAGSSANAFLTEIQDKSISDQGQPGAGDLVPGGDQVFEAEEGEKRRQGLIDPLHRVGFFASRLAPTEIVT
jgi:hypothetical protein